MIGRRLTKIATAPGKRVLYYNSENQSGAVEYDIRNLERVYPKPKQSVTPPLSGVEGGTNQPPNKSEQPSNKQEKQEKQPSEQKQEKQEKQPSKQKQGSTIKVGDKVKSRDGKRGGVVVGIDDAVDHSGAKVPGVKVYTVDWQDVPVNEAVQTNIPQQDIVLDIPNKGKDEGEDEGEDEGKDSGGDAGSGGGDSDGGGDDSGEGGGGGDSDGGDDSGEGGGGGDSDGGGDDSGGGTGSESGESSESGDVTVVIIRGAGAESDWDYGEGEVEPADPADARKMRQEPITKEKIKGIIDAAKIEQASGRGAGGSSAVTDLLIKAYSTKTDWTTLLRKFLNKGEPQKSGTRSLERPGRRSGILGRYLPSEQPKPVNIEKTIVVAIDTSGSVFNSAFLDRFFSEVFRIVKTQKVKVVLMLWHTDVYAVKHVDASNVRRVLGEIKPESGGTQLSCVAEWLIQPENKKIIKSLAGVVYITDLDIERSPKLVKHVPVAVFGPEKVMNKGMVEVFKKAGHIVATYDTPGEQI